MEEIFEINPGTLYVVGTPIGNTGDFSPRAKAVCSAVDTVLAEDTRVSGRLLRKFEIFTPLLSFHEHNTQRRIGELIPELHEGKSFALVTDAGMPCISDPGFELVAACRSADIPVAVVPGPTALITALAGSGLSSRRFAFEGFLPVKGKERRQRLEILAQATETQVLYEAPHRLNKTLQDLIASGAGERKLVLGRELTKQYEEFLTGTATTLAEYYNEREPRGEYVLVLEGSAAFAERQPAAEQRQESDHLSQEENSLLTSEIALGATIAKLLASGRSSKDIVRHLETEGLPGFGKVSLKRNNLYNLIQEIKN